MVLFIISRITGHIKMPRRCYEHDLSSEKGPPRKKSSSGISNSIHFKQGEIVSDLCSKKWKIGKPIGIGGFGEIYEATDILTRDVETDSLFVAKIEKHSSGPLFVEINCYLRIAKSQMIEEWKNENRVNFLGMPHYVASGSHYYNGEKYRFLMLPKYKKDLEQVFREKKLFNIKTVSTIGIQILDVLQYIHSKGYVHSDIKASNIMLGKPNGTVSVSSRTRHATRKSSKSECVLNKNKIAKTTTRKVSGRNLRPIGVVNYIDDLPFLEEALERHERKRNKEFYKNSSSVKRNDNVNSDHVYLLDYGLASKYLLSNGEHKEFCTDERRAHAGTVLFCSRDAHKGVQSRRSDLESLGYNIVYWMTGSLPWIENLEQPLEVEKKKIRCFSNLKSFLELCFNNDFPSFILEYFEYLNGLQFEENPNYDFCRRIFKKAMKTYGYKEDDVLDFDNLQGWGIKKKKPIAPKNNLKVNTCGSFLKTSPLMPLHSNIVFHRPKLRKKTKNNNNNLKVQDSMMNWSKILTDPETIIKQARERKTTESSSDLGTSNLSSIDIESMNPTYAMWEVYNRCKDREASPRYKGECYVPENIEDYTPAMMSVYTKMMERKALENTSDSFNKSDSEISFRVSSKKRTRSHRRRGSESPTVQRNIRTKSQPYVGRRREVLHPFQVKKVKSSPIRRTYSLRG